MEYGLTDAVTLFAAPEYVLAETGTGGPLIHARSQAVEAGGRILLLSHIGMLSIQSSFKTAGAFDMSVSASGQAGRQVELRLLYGRSFKALGRDAFFDAEVAERWIKRPRPNEMDADIATGLWLNPRYLVMVQSFNMISGSGAKPPYSYYRMHKLEGSLVMTMTRHWSLQSGYFFTPWGQNVVQESGVLASLWFRF